MREDEFQPVGAAPWRLSCAAGRAKQTGVQTHPGHTNDGPDREAFQQIESGESPVGYQHQYAIGHPPSDLEYQLTRPVGENLVAKFRRSRQLTRLCSPKLTQGPPAGGDDNGLAANGLAVPPRPEWVTLSRARPAKSFHQ